jgi:hypothetical protein
MENRRIADSAMRADQARGTWGFSFRVASFGVFTVSEFLVLGQDQSFTSEVPSRREAVGVRKHPSERLPCRVDAQPGLAFQAMQDGPANRLHLYVGRHEAAQRTRGEMRAASYFK